MSVIKSFRDLEVWVLAMELVTTVYQLTETFPRHEVFGLTAQMRRSAISIPANIAEGHNRRKRGPYRYHVQIALGSQGELDTLTEVTLRLGYATREGVARTQDLTSRVGQMLSKLSRSLTRAADTQP